MFFVKIGGPTVWTVDTDRLDGMFLPMDTCGGISLRDRVLDAAEAVVVRQGIANLTLEAVAADAGLSKGGLLHHFPNKDHLIKAMVDRCADHWRLCMREAHESIPEGPGRMARALLSHLADQESWTEQCQRGSCAVFAALAQNPALIEPMRAVYGEMRVRLADDGLPPGIGETIIAAMDGLWLYRVLGLTTVNKELMDQIRGVLEPLLPALPSSQSSEPAITPEAASKAPALGQTPFGER